MFKSASQAQFQNTAFSSTSYLTLSTPKYDSKSPVQTKPKKGGVKFEIEIDKENTRDKSPIFQSSPVKRRDKHLKSWTYQHIPSQTQIKNQKNALKQLMGGFNYEKRSGRQGEQNTSNSLSKFHHTDGFTYSSKKLIQSGSKKFIDQPTKFQRSYKQCRSMKIINCPNSDDQSQISTFKSKRPQRKFPKFEAYNQLLKQSQNLIQKYKKLQEQKSKLRTDLKNQIEYHSKSSKKIMLLEDAEASKKYQTPQSPLYNSVEVRSPKPREFGINLPKYGNYEKYESPKYNQKYEVKLPKSPSYSQSSMNKTFSSLSKPSTSTEDSIYLKPEVNSYSYNGSFGLSKSSSSKKISSSGISLDDFELGKCLGSGAFGQVFPAKHKKTGWLFALKKVKKQSVKHMLDQFIQQIKIQLFLDHPNVVKLYSFFNDELHFYILMEFMQGGSLYSYLKKQKTLSLEETSVKLREVCEGLQHMHENSVLHRDIKPQNIVMCHNVSKLCDFGWSTICKDRRTTYCGTLDYVSPQIIQGDGYDDSVDIWCVGVLAYELLVGKTPFYNISRKQTMKKILDCNLEYPATMPEVAVKFVKNILKKNPDHRQTIDQILKDPLLKISQNTASMF